jgi:serine protease Do
MHFAAGRRRPGRKPDLLTSEMNKQHLLSATLAATIAAAVTSVGAQFAFANEAHPVNPAPTAPAAAAPPSFADIVAKVAPAVVSVDVDEKPTPAAAVVAPGAQTAPFGPGVQAQPFGPGGDADPFGQLRKFFGIEPQVPQGPVHATGSGFFISPDGYIVTNNHVVENASKVTVRSADGKTLPARIVGRDPATDLAVLKVDGDNHPFVSFEDRAKPRVGDWVVAVGNPFNLGGTATAGIVSALRRPNVSGSSYVDYMQIDAPINRGNSGGPSFDLYGRVVGVNTAIFTPTGGSVGIGFDIPADVAASVAKQLIATGKVTRGYIGATVQDVTPDIAASIGVAAQHGALVADVTPDGPSARAGLQSGDIIEAVNGRAVTSASDLTREVGRVQPGQDISLQVRRDGRTQTLKVHSGLRPSEKQLASNDLGGGPPAAAGGLGLMVAPHAGGGLTVERVDPASDAGEKGLEAGDVIKRVGERPANSPADVRAALNAARAAHRDEVLLLVSHQGHNIYLPVKVPSAQG